MGEVRITFTSIMDTIDGIQVTFQLDKNGISELGNVTFTGQLGAIDPWTFERTREHTFQIVSYSPNCPDLDCCIKGKDWKYAKGFRFFLAEELKQNPNNYLHKSIIVFNYNPMGNE